ncbi:M20/M25/M40 family metallo-hydrolase [Nonomuraea sp. NPDC050310]|uniref:M20/M25/M40 family metallo-hydrolase n=1 Tax=unclassified Nonomuraea TaxID=2593643 RepID=UPI0033CF6F80
MTLSTAELTSRLAGLRPTHASDGAALAAELTAAELTEHGLTAELRERDGARQVLATCDLGPGGRHVVLNGHLDIDQPIMDDSGGELRSGRIHGTGTSDMLGGVATIVTAVAELARRSDLHGRLTVQLVADGHRDGAGTNALAALLDDAELAILTEPTDRHVCTTAYGFSRHRLTSWGAPGPMAYAADVHNAATHAAAAVLALNDANEELRQLYPTRQGIRYVLPGRVAAGLDPSTPALSGEVDFTLALPPLLPAEVARKVIDDRLHDRFHPAGLPLPSWSERELLSPATSLGHTTFADLLRTVNPGLSWCQYPCPSDAHVFQELGVPMVLYGPGDTTRTRRPGEHVEVAELEECGRTLTSALVLLLAKGAES